MHQFNRLGQARRGLMALFWVISVAGCGSGGGGDSSAAAPVPVLTSSTPARTPGTLAPGESQPGTTGGTGTTGSTGTTGGTGGTGSGTVSGPTVLSSNPTDGASNVAVSMVDSNNLLVPRTINATFSEAMNPVTINSPAVTFTVKNRSSGNNVAGTVSLNAANTLATFTPSANLASNTLFTATITQAATNPAGTPLVGIYEWSFSTGTREGQAPINLRTATSFLVLGGTSIANFSDASNPSRVNGQLGINPGTAVNVSGFTDSTPSGTGIISTGGIQSGAVVIQAKTDLATALGEAKARTLNEVLVGTGDLSIFVVNGGVPGVYPPGLYASSTSLALGVGNITLDAQGDPDAVWVFKAGSNLNVGNTRKIVLKNGAKARNVFWTLESSAFLGDGVDFKGNILAGTSNAIGSAAALGAAAITGSTVEGRVLSVSGLTLYATTINQPAP